MRKLWKIVPALLALVMASACTTQGGSASARTPRPAAQRPAPQKPVTPARTAAPPRRGRHYSVEAASQMPGFTLLINGAVLLSGEGGGPVSSRAEINDWMVSGNNEIMVDLFWPEAVRFVPGSTARFRLFANDTPIKDFRWPASGVSDNLGSGNYTFKENFKADGFPRVQLERAERVISSAGVLPRGDQNEITALAENLRRAFTEKNISGIDSLFRTKYTDLAMARFTSPTTLRNRADASYQELMNKEAYAVRPFTGRYSFFSIADGRAVRLVQGRIGFPEPALVINYRENGKAARYDLDLYFAKIDGKWVIIR